MRIWHANRLSRSLPPAFAALGITSKEQAPQRLCGACFLMQSIVKRDAEGHQYPYR
jgi:hypothetical protein